MGLRYFWAKGKNKQCKIVLEELQIIISDEDRIKYLSGRPDPL
jgi:hypothetical protein